MNDSQPAPKTPAPALEPVVRIRRVLMASRGFSRAQAESFAKRLTEPEQAELANLWDDEKGLLPAVATQVREINNRIDQRFESEKATVDESSSQGNSNVPSFLPPAS